MELIQWDESYSVKNDTIDQQHKKLFSLINEFNQNVSLDSANEKMEKLLQGLKDYIVFHFKTEEMYLKMCNYPHYEQHKKEHEKFIEKVADIEHKYLNGTFTNLSEITAFFKAWITHHIKKSDGDYTEFILNVEID